MALLLKKKLLNSIKNTVSNSSFNRKKCLGTFFLSRVLQYTLLFCYSTYMSKLIVLSGVPGSGKSYFCKKLLENTTGHIYIVSSDQLRKEVGGHQQNLDNEATIWDMFYKLPKVYSEDKEGIVVLDSTNTLRKYRIDANIDFKNYFDEIDLVYFDIEKDILLKQNLEREFPIPSEAIIYYFDTFERPNEIDEAFFDNIYIIRERDFSSIIDEIIQKK